MFNPTDANNDISQQIRIPDKPQTLVNSSSIQGYSYDDQNYVLYVWYKGKQQPIYRYLMVFPIQFAQIFNEGGSIGLKARNSLKANPKLKVR
jgi:hypothetical protein